MYSGDIWVSEWKRNSSYIGGGGAVGIPLDNIYEETLIQMFMISSLSIEFVHFFRLFQYSRKPCGQSVYVEPVSGSSSRSGIKSTIQFRGGSQSEPKIDCFHIPVDQKFFEDVLLQLIVRNHAKVNVGFEMGACVVILLGCPLQSLVHLQYA